MRIDTTQSSQIGPTSETGIRPAMPWLRLAGAWLLVVGVAWLIAGTGLWQAVAFWGAVPALFLLGRAFFVPRCRTLAPVGLTGAWLLWYGIGIQFAWGYVYVDNFSPHDVVLRLDGNDWLTLERDATAERRLRRGLHQVSVHSDADGKELDRLQIEVQSRYGLLTTSTNNYVLNVLGAQRYRREQAIYSTSPESWPWPSGSVIQEKWFKVDTDYIFEDPPLFGQGGSTVTCLRRVPK